MAKNRLHSLAATGFVALLAGPALAQDAAAPAKADPASPASTPAPAPAPNPKPAAKLELRVTQTVLDGPDGGTQLILTDTAGEHARDVTGEAVFKAEPANVVTIDRRGYVTAAGDGKASIVATLPNAGAAPARVEITVSNFGRNRPPTSSTTSSPSSPSTTATAAAATASPVARTTSAFPCWATNPGTTATTSSASRAGAASFPPRRKTACC